MGAFDSPARTHEFGKELVPSASGVIVRLQAAALSQASLVDAATAFAIEVASALRCQRASLGLVEGGSINLIATSSGRELEMHGEAERAISAAMNESFDQAATLQVPANPAAPISITLAQQRLAALSLAFVCSIPVVCFNRTTGVLTLERSGEPFSAAEVLLAEDAACFAGPLLSLKRDAERSWWARLLDSFKAQFTMLGAREKRGARVVALGVAVLLTSAAFVPISYRVSAPARLEGSVQRAIVAPADGFLRQANVRAGDRVRAGQVLAELAGEDMQLERRRRESELRQHEQAYKSAMARSDRAQMVIHQAKAGEAQAMLALADSQLERAQIQAPFDGVVIKGDLTQNLGAPVQRGEVLLTIAPGDSFRLIVEVDEADIARIQAGQRGQLVLAAQPDTPVMFEVRRVLPVATAAESRNYFDVEATLDSPGLALRPGLRGVAKIEAGKRSLFWTVLHRPWEKLRLWLWSVTL